MRKRFYKWSVLTTFFGVIVFLLPVSVLALGPGLYIPDLYNDVVYKFDLSTSELSEFYLGADGPFFLEKDEDGNLLISVQNPPTGAVQDTGEVVRVTPLGDYDDTIAQNLTRNHGMALDSSGNLYVVELDGRIVKIPPGGGAQTLVEADELGTLADAEFDDEGNLYISVVGQSWDPSEYEPVGPPDGQVLRISNADLDAFDGVTPLTIGDGIEVIADGLSWPTGLAYRNGQLYVAEYAEWFTDDWDEDEGQIISIDLDDFDVSTYFSPISSPVGLAFDELGDLYVAQGVSKQVSMIDDTGSSSDVVVAAGAFDAFDGGAEADLGGLIYVPVPNSPVIDMIVKTKRYPGQVVQIVGSGFGDPEASSEVHFSKDSYAATDGQVKEWTDTLIKVWVPDYDCEWFRDLSVRARKIWVTVGGQDSNIKKIKVMRPDTCSPVIDYIVKTKRYPGQVVQIVGSGFGDPVKSSKVHFSKARYAATSGQVKEWTDTLIKVWVPKYSCSWFGDLSVRARKIWVTVAVDSNIERIKVMRPATCN
jgi:sugar lactone lactonase YvrE